MQTQPSAQGIAQLYMGNPGALQQRVQKEQQAKPGLPPDLKKLMALNIVTNEQDAAKRQQAMNALNSMAPAGEEPPTVAQSVQEQAKQAMQAKMLQQQRQQQGLQALAQRSPSMEVPEGVPQPEAQPQGIDDLPVEMEFARGGIVAFADGDKVFSRMDQEKADKLKMLEGLLQQVNSMLTAAAKSGDPRAIQTYASQAASVRDQINKTRQDAGNRLDVIEGMAGLKSPAPQPAAPRPAAAPAGIDQLMSPEEMPTQIGVGRAPRTPAAPRPLPGSMMPSAEEAGLASAVSDIALPTSTRPASVSEAQATAAAGPQAAVPPATPRPTKERVAPTPRPAAERPAPTAPAAPVAAAPTTQAAPATGLDALYEQNIRKRMEMDPEARAKAFGERYKKEIGAPDTSQYDRLIAELENRKKQFDAPKAGFDAFAEYMGQIAAQGPQRDWATAGAQGAAAQTALNKERQAQQFDLTKQGIDIAQKKLDTVRGFNKELFTLTEKERDDINKEVQEFTKEYGLSKRDADKYKRDLEMEALRHKNAVTLEGVRAKNQAANRPFDLQGELAKAILAGDKPRAEKLREALSMAAGAKKPGLDMELLKKFENLPGVKSEMEMLTIYRNKKDPKPADLTRIQEVEARLSAKAKAAGIDPAQIGLGSSTSTTKTGDRTIDFNAIP